MQIKILLRIQTLFCLMFLFVLVETLNAQPFELREGVVVDPASKLAYVMNPKGGIDAVDLLHGTSTWHTDQASKPLALLGDRLIAQIEPVKGDNTLEVAILNVKNRGEKIAATATKLPADIKVTIDDNLKSSFHTYAQTSAGNVYIFWQYAVQPLSPAAQAEPSPDQKVQKEAEMPSSGTLQINSTGEISVVSKRQVPLAVVKRPADLASNERLPKVSGPQFRSADNKNVQSPERIANDTVWEKYRWIIYDRPSENKIGEIRNFQSYKPFFVFDTQIIFETDPYQRQTEKGQIDEPLKIRALNLQTGQELWSWEVRDTTYRGPSPP